MNSSSKPETMLTVFTIYNVLKEKKHKNRKILLSAALQYQSLH